jgi:pyruvate carboxylase
LEEYHLLGIRTNIAYLRRIIMHPEFISGNYDTHFIPKYQASLLESETEKCDEDSIALVTAGILSFLNNKKRVTRGPTNERRKISTWKIAGRIRNLGNMGG